MLRMLKLPVAHHVRVGGGEPGQASCPKLPLAHHAKVDGGEPGLVVRPHHVRVDGGGGDKASVHVMSQVGLVGNQR